MTNIALASRILGWLKARGVRDICLCPGGRNAPFVEILSQAADFQIHSSFDERSAGFFALGLALRNKAPAAIVTTSGTAVAEVLPSVMEAHYAAIPLIVISADRPKRLRGTGAPQAVEQAGIFGVYAEVSLDLENEFSAPDWSGERPLHINVCFDEPLLDEPFIGLPEVATPAPKPSPIRHLADGRFHDVSQEFLAESFHRFIQNKSHPLLLVGTLSEDEAAVVKPFVQRWRGAVYCESPSGLREMPQESRLISGDRALVRAWKQKNIDAVVRLGGVPTARLWRTLETTDFPIFSISSRPFPGLSRGEFFHCRYEELRAVECPNLTAVPELLTFDREQQRQWSALMELYPRSEPALISWVSRQIRNPSTVYIGNSLPIREWDLVAQREVPLHVLANRGANGIDGQLSTALAFLSPRKPLWVLLGDLTTLYDSNALWFWKANPHPLKVVVINNRGGQIFSRMFKSKLFCNSHDLDFAAWAAQWSLPYRSLLEPAALGDESCLLEIQPDAEQTKTFWRDYDKIWDV